jgi:hypothetical protein
MKVKYLTQTQKKKVDKIDLLLTQLRKEGVYPYIFGGGGSNLVFIRHADEDADQICDILLSPGDNYKEYKKIKEREYEAQESYKNVIEALGL